MNTQILQIIGSNWHTISARPEWVTALESGKVLYFPQLAFALTPQEKQLLRPEVRDPRSRNISLNVDGTLKGAAGDEATRLQLVAMVQRFRAEAVGLISRLFPAYAEVMRIAPTSFRPMQVETRSQSWRADDRRMHVDAFPSRPNYGERILRVFTNVNPDGAPRVWRVGEPFEDVARRFLPRAKPYVAWQARALKTLHVTKSFRSEYDHLMLQLHDGMKSDSEYQQHAPQETVEFAAGSSWVCFSDQAVHSVMAGQYMLEQTLFLPPGSEYDKAASLLAILTGMKGHALVDARR
ncbi:Kdo hydroxylase family protein [Diaphorobacter aerolatus]|uniref:Kdo hydroxylase family protein n=1 Tax=Diaphorobacter aerolatus TaxID=1288495 RepID=A0A7H0GLQ3_9BURK|nr:Kdo hydroxylase family protein [Diaphorobacter aerolatus]QNP49219.1 Kdo hydroxylase family protein [Diaphorobacter aerolatus]